MSHAPIAVRVLVLDDPGIRGSKTGSGSNGLIGATGRDQVTALIALYGPRTTVLVGLDDGKALSALRSVAHFELFERIKWDK